MRDSRQPLLSLQVDLLQTSDKKRLQQIDSALQLAVTGQAGIPFLMVVMGGSVTEPRSWGASSVHTKVIAVQHTC